MKYGILITLLFTIAFRAAAAGADTVRYSATGPCWSIVHRLAPGEQLSFVGQRYRVPAGTLERAYPALVGYSGTGELIDVPVGAYNRITDMPWSLDTARPLYYRVQPGERLADISRCARMSRNDLMLINGLSGEPAAGAYLCVGWVRYDRRLMASSQPPLRGKIVPPPPPVAAGTSAAHVPPVPALAPVYMDTAIPPIHPPAQTMGDIFNEQTNNGENITTEKGSVAFYTLNSKAPGAAAYAFHNSAPRGGIIRVRNLNNGKSIYVKVLGPIPNTKQYYGAILGLTMTAKRALGVKEERAFCELAFAGY